jgi:nucleotide-binding universal stress UspA family protein
VAGRREHVGWQNRGVVTFARIVCGVHPSLSSRHAVEQAIALGELGTTVVFVCVREGLGAQRGSGSHRGGDARAAIEQAMGAASAAGIEGVGRVVEADNASEVLLRESRDADILVVASHGASPAGTSVLGSTAASAVHTAAQSVLVARRPPERIGFPQRIIVASDGSEHALRAARVAGRIARRHRSQLYLLRVQPVRRGSGGDVSADAEVAAGLGSEATAIHERGLAHERIVAVARREAACLVVVGSRGLSGGRPLGSVSERVVHKAPCSVLVSRASQ